ncbi:hypothetical protein BT96DRAFT_48849 [Gymnopus androsaceus JB14]|uniref:Uncharacterized protein n=1 Tax=Gymnopus androsaceus JB14 TaxID=1447944 RepID=A0A6A4HJP6_9AGAR|nr:hypothetical protein BT96DRAFT_48849 [Gymnopus androsaceus JB14]
MNIDATRQCVSVAWVCSRDPFRSPYIEIRPFFCLCSEPHPSRFIVLKCPTPPLPLVTTILALGPTLRVTTTARATTEMGPTRTIIQTVMGAITTPTPMDLHITIPGVVTLNTTLPAASLTAAVATTARSNPKFNQ